MQGSHQSRTPEQEAKVERLREGETMCVCEVSGTHISTDTDTDTDTRTDTDTHNMKQTIGPGHVSLAVSPLRMVRQPTSQPLMTLPRPTGNENVCCPGSLVLQKGRDDVW